MAEAIVSLLLEKIAGYARDEMRDEILKAATAKVEIEKLEAKLKAIQPILRGALNKQFLSKEVKDWVWRLNEVAYDALDVIDLYRIKSHTFSGPVDSRRSKVRKALNSIPKLPNKILLLHKTGTKIKKINERLNTIYEEKDLYDLGPQLEEPSRLGDHLGSVPGQERLTTSGIIETKIVGREKDEEMVIKWLLEESNIREASASVIAIVAMGGVGKTALAKNICHNSSIKKYFDECLWVCVSEMPKLLDLFKRILEEVDKRGSSSDQFTNANTLRSKIINQLKDKTFLLVLDDVWDYGWWDEVRGLWRNCRSGSKVLITSRRLEVAKAMGLAQLHELKCLNEEQSWQLFVNKVLKGDETEEDLDGVKDVGRDIARKCGGLPLALNVIGSLLHHQERRKSDWQNILCSELWNWQGPHSENKVFATIALSYMSISFKLKQCLAYCCMYAKDFRIKKIDLTRHWVAEGFISKEAGVEIEVTAERYLDTLVGCSLIQDAGNGYYTLHDIIHDFALFIKEKEYINMDQLKSGLVSHHARYVSSFGGDYSPEALRGQEKLRGLMCREVDCLPTFSFAAFRWLRVLDLSGGRFSELPVSVGDLMLLKYVNLSGTKIFELPDSITTLCELQTLDLSWSDVKRLPKKISSLGALRHLDIYKTSRLEYLPSEIGKLTCLQTLSKFIVGSSNRILDGTGSSLSELRDLNNIRGSLRIEHLERVGSLEEVDHAQLKRKENLQSLELSCDSKCMIEFDKTVIEKVEQVYEWIEPPKGIQEISISSYPGIQCPMPCMNSTSYSCLQKVTIYDCKFLESLPNLGLLPNLVDLTIRQVNEVKVFGSSSFNHDYGKVAFPKLERLCLWSMESLEEWQCDAEVKSMPCLEQLNISGGCRKLRVIPFFSTLKKLTIIEVDEWEGWPLSRERNIPCLKDMSITSCEKLKFLPDCPKLESLSIIKCDQLVELPHFPVLVSAKIARCPLVSCPWIPTPELKELKHLEIICCPKLEMLLQGLQDDKLETLVIDGCSNLTSVPAATRLKKLSLGNLPQLQSLPTTFIARGLKELSLNDLPQLRSLPVTCLDGMKGLEKLELGHELAMCRWRGCLPDWS